MGVLGLDMAEQRLDPRLVGRRARPAEVLVDRAQRHELAGGSGGHLRAVIAHRQQDRPGGVVVSKVECAVQPGGDLLHEPSASSASQKAAWTWTLVSSALTTSHSHLRDTKSSITVTAIFALVKWVVSKIHNIPGLSWTQSGNGWRMLRAGRAAGAAADLGQQHPPHTGGRHPHPLQVGAAVGELAVRAVGLAPLVEQPDDLGDLIVEQPVDRVAAGRQVLQPLGGLAGQPPPRPGLAKLQRAAGSPHRPPGLGRVVEQGQQPGLGGRIHPRRDLATQPNALFPPPAAA